VQDSSSSNSKQSKSIPKSKGISAMDLKKLNSLNKKVTKTKFFKITLILVLIVIVLSSAYLLYLNFSESIYKEADNKDEKFTQMETALLSAKQFADDSPIKAIKAIENYSALPKLLENRKNYILTQLYQKIDEPALAFLSSNKIDRSYLPKYSCLQRAKIAEKMGLEAVVVKELEFLSSKFPKEPIFLYELAKSYSRQNLNDEAAKIFHSIQKLHPDTDYALGADYYLANITNDQNEKIKRLQHYLQTSPEGSLAYLISDQLNIIATEDTSLKNYKAISYFSQSNYDKAIEFFDTNIDDPDLYLDAYVRTLAKLNRKTEAISVLQELLPRIKNENKAKDLLEYLIELKPKHDINNTLRSLVGKLDSGIDDKIFWEIAKRTKVKDDYKNVYENYPDSFYAAESMAKVFWQEYDRGNYHGALEIYKTHWEKYPYANSHSFVAFWAGKIHLKRNEADSARAVLQNLIIEHPRDYYSYRADQILNKKADWFMLPGANTFMSFPTWKWPGVYPDTEIEKLYGEDILELTRIDEFDFILELGKKNQIQVDKEFEMWLQAQSGKYMQAIRTAARSLTKETPIDYKNIKFQYAYPLAYADIISDEVGKNLKIDPQLVHALIRQESFYQKDIVSKAGAIGLMQLMPYTAKDLARTIGIKPPRPYDLMKPSININLGVKYMEEVFARYNNNMINAIASYNAGPVAVKNWERKYRNTDPDEYIEKIPYEETKGYVKHVLNNYWIYKQLYT
jgi:soluble lytic murein transglycosylase